MSDCMAWRGMSDGTAWQGMSDCMVWQPCIMRVQRTGCCLRGFSLRRFGLSRFGLRLLRVVLCLIFILVFVPIHLLLWGSCKGAVINLRQLPVVLGLTFAKTRYIRRFWAERFNFYRFSFVFLKGTANLSIPGWAGPAPHEPAWPAGRSRERPGIEILWKSFGNAFEILWKSFIISHGSTKLIRSKKPWRQNVTTKWTRSKKPWRQN